MTLSKKLIIFSSLAAFPLSTYAAGSAWALGVSKESGWHDINKSWSGDGNLCWAAVSSNILQWWQTVYINAGNELPENVPHGLVAGKETAVKRQYQIFEYFVENWNNAAGYAFNGISWYLTGEVYGWYNSQAAKLVTDADAAGFFSELYPNKSGLETLMHKSWGSAFSDYETFSSLLIDAFEDGLSVISMSVTIGSTKHAITVWGCDYDEDNLVTTLHFTDSDDGKLQLYSIAVTGDSSSVSLQNFWYNGSAVSVNRFESLSVANIPNIASLIPEPSAFGLLAGVAALAFAGTRRRRK